MANLKVEDLDLALTGGQLVLASDLEAIDQSLRSRLAMVRGEWFLDTAAGVDYRRLAWKKRPDLRALRAALRDTILATPGVTALRSLDLDFDATTRALTVSFSATTEAGPIDYRETTP